MDQNPYKSPAIEPDLKTVDAWFDHYRRNPWRRLLLLVSLYVLAMRYKPLPVATATVVLIATWAAACWLTFCANLGWLVGLFGLLSWICCKIWERHYQPSQPFANGIAAPRGTPPQNS